MGKNHQSENLQRGLDNRHIQLIALGGAIGVGLFYGSSAAIQMAGPSILFSYLVGGLVIFIIMRALGELAVDRSQMKFLRILTCYYEQKTAEQPLPIS